MRKSLLANAIHFHRDDFLTQPGEFIKRIQVQEATDRFVSNNIRALAKKLRIPMQPIFRERSHSVLVYKYNQVNGTNLTFEQILEREKELIKAKGK